MRGFRFGFGFTMKAEEAGGFSFSDADANAYYDALVVANGGDIDSVALYSIDLDTLKSTINTLFVDLKANNIYIYILRLYLFVGATDVTHAINAMNAVSELLYVASPLQNATGMVLNGTDQYADLNNVPSTDMVDYDNHIMVDLAITDYNFAFGSRDAILETIYFYLYSAAWLFDNPDTSGSGGRLVAASVNNFNGNIIGTRVSNTLSYIYKDGSVHGTNATMVTTDLPENTMFLGAYNNQGTANQFGATTIRTASIGDGLSGAQSSAYSTIINTFNSALGR